MSALPPPLPSVPSPTRRRLRHLYLAAWTLLATGALGYLGALAVRPDLVAPLSRFRPADPETNEGQRSLSRALAEIQQLRQGQTVARQEISALRTLLTAQEEREKALIQRLASLEERAASQPQTAAAATPAPSAPAVKTAAKPAEPPKPPPAVAAAPPPAAKTAPASVVTGSLIDGRIEEGPLSPGKIDLPPISAPALPGVAPAKPPATAPPPAPVTFGPAIVKPAGDPVAVQLATGPSVDAVRLSWNLLNERHKTLLKNLEPRYVTSGEGESATYQLVAGPIATPEEATRVCATLRTRKVPCRVTSFAGEGF